MVPAMALVSATATPEYRGSFMSVVSCVQQLACALGSTVAGLMIVQNEQGQLLNYPWVGLIAVVISLLALITFRKLKVPAAAKV